jgi:hypothetical protein
VTNYGLFSSSAKILARWTSTFAGAYVRLFFDIALRGGLATFTTFYVVPRGAPAQWIWGTRQGCMLPMGGKHGTT